MNIARRPKGIRLSPCPCNGKAPVYDRELDEKNRPWFGYYCPDCNRDAATTTRLSSAGVAWNKVVAKLEAHP